MFKMTTANANADYCSRAVKDAQIGREKQVSALGDFDIFMVRHISFVQIASETRIDAKFGQIIGIPESSKSL